MRGGIKTGKHWIFWAGFAVVLLWLASALTTSQSGFSIWGLGAETSTLFSLIIFLVLAWLVSALFAEPAALGRLLMFSATGLGIFVVLSLLSVLGALQWLGGPLTQRTFSTMGSWNGAGIAAGLFAVMLYPFILAASGFWRWVVYALFGLSMLLMLMVNFSLAWLILGLFALLILCYGVWSGTLRGAAMVTVVLLLAFSLLGYFFEKPIANTVEALGVVPPLEVGVNHPTTFGIIKSTLSKDMFLGNGPATFGYLWDQEKPVAVNQTPFWGVRFASGSSYFLTLLAELGVLGWLVFMTFVLGLWYLSLRAVTSHAASEYGLLVLAPFLLLSYTVFMWALYPINFALAALGFLFLGIALAALRASGLMKSRSFTLFSEGTRGFVSAIFIVIFVIASLGGLYVTVTRYMGQLAYSKGIEIFNESGDLNATEQKLLSAVKFDSQNDLYYRTLSDVYLLRARLLLQNQQTTADLLASQFKDVLDASLAAAQNAEKVSPMDFLNFESMGKIYEFLVPLGTEGAAEAALAQYDLAIKLAPVNPALLRDKALVYFGRYGISQKKDDLKQAEALLVKSTELKPDYAAAHYLLAQVLVAEGNEKDAIARSEAAALLAPNDIGALFQLGLLYYRNQRYADSEAVFTRAVTLNDNYANARYFLGLIYDKNGNKQRAIEEFKKVAALNPSNEEVKKILVNLQGGKSALAGISPPSQLPEKRIEPPVKEQGN